MVILMEVNVKYQGIINKSRTHDFAAALVVMGAIQMYLPQLEIPHPWDGAITMVVGVLVAYLRYITTGPVGQK
jgi:hypothetical protein